MNNREFEKLIVHYFGAGFASFIMSERTNMTDKIKVYQEVKQG
ncbi:Uncharacterised protein [Yersinia thracica]|uniref:Uncharacterized protein n=1 Tax=Yersinia thracica TaxID=2890319 RepID=A0A0T9QGA7_9GAMM|nr:Uncharacterised protein [Yersinia thracica]